MASQTNSAAETSGTNATASSGLHDLIQVEPSPHFVKKLVFDDHGRKNKEFSKLSVEYFDHNQKAINYSEAVKKYFNSFQSFIQIQDAEALNICHEQFFNDLHGVSMQQEQMKNNLQSFRDNLSQKLHRAKIWKIFYAVGFTAAVVMTTAAVNAFAKKMSIAAAVTLLDLLASALTYLPGPFWGWTFSLVQKCDDDVKKYFEIIGSMALGVQITAHVVSHLLESARRFQTQTRSISEMAESADADEERKKLVESFQELQEIAAVFCQETPSARKCSFDSVKIHI